jgi:hypothetical protein
MREASAPRIFFYLRLHPSQSAPHRARSLNRSLKEMVGNSAEVGAPGLAFEIWESNEPNSGLFPVAAVSSREAR